MISQRLGEGLLIHLSAAAAVGGEVGETDSFLIGPQFNPISATVETIFLQFNPGYIGDVSLPGGNDAQKLTLQ